MMMAFFHLKTFFIKSTGETALVRPGKIEIENF
jgi:hypothetical protein